MNFGDNLRELRKTHKMSQEKLAEKVNVSRQSISKWENGESYPEMKNIMILCDIFNCKINDLVNDTIVENDSLDEEVKKVVIKFKENQQKRMKILSKITFIIAKVVKIVTFILAICLFLSLIIIPILFKDFDITNDTIKIFNKEIKYEIEDSNILIIDGKKNFINTSTDLNEFISKHSNIFYIISIEYIVACFGFQLLALFALAFYLEKLYSNIYKDDTPFTLKNVKIMKLLSIFLGIMIWLPKVSGTLYSIIVKLDLGIEYKPIDFIIILIVLSLIYIFEYGYEIQLDSNGKIYGKPEDVEK